MAWDHNVLVQKRSIQHLGVTSPYPERCCPFLIGADMITLCDRGFIKSNLGKILFNIALQNTMTNRTVR